MKIKEMLRSKPQSMAALRAVLYWFCAIVYWEWLLHMVALGELRSQFGFVLGFSFVFGAGLALVTTFLKEKLRFITETAVTVVMIILYGSQMVYYYVFATLYSVSQIQQGGAAVTSFWKETVVTMWEHLPALLCLFLPLIVLVLLRKLCKGGAGKTNWLWRIVMILLAAAMQVGTLACIPMGGTGYFTDYHYYHSDTSTTDQVASRFGLLTAFRLDIFGSGQEETVEEEVSYYVPVETQPETRPEEPDATEATEPAVVEYNVLEFDFDDLNGQTDKEKIQAINAYCASVPGTNKNEYTGMLADYNLILVCAESFATGALDPELTPTLYKMANQGFVFNNYYNTYPNNTTDGEYTLCMGLYPDSSRNKEASSFYASRRSYLPFCLGNLFQEQRGITSWGYHNASGDYYGRDETHPNMGYSVKFAGRGMKFSGGTPYSDLEMLEQTVDDYLSADSQFHAYYMTFSGHYKYDRSINPMAARNWNAVKHLPYSDPVKAYLACNIELDKAMAYLMQRLEETGVADKTAIVLIGDHFPYGLMNKQYSELVGYQIDSFTKFKSSWLFWVGGMEETVEVDEYCCNADVLPTILNLWGFDYDSRMLAGTDVFSDGTHIAILSDSSFFTDKVWFSAETGEARYLVDEATLPQDYVQNMIRLIEAKRSLSVDILNTAYYNFVFGKEAVYVNRGGW